MSIEYKVVGFREAWPLVKELVQLQWEEVDHRREITELDVMEDKYEAMEDLGMNYIVLATEDDLPVGYCSMFITDSPHTGTLHAVSDVMYTIKELRGTGIGLEMISLAEQEGIDRGANHIMITLKNSASHENLVEKLGFFSYETVYCKAIRMEECQ